MHYKLLAKTMHDISNDLVLSNLKDLFVPTVKIHSYNTQASVSKNFYIQKSNTEIKRKSLFIAILPYSVPILFCPRYFD